MAILGLSLFYLNFRIPVDYFYIENTSPGNLPEIVLNLQINLERTDILAIVSLLIWEHSISFHFFRACYSSDLCFPGDIASSAFWFSLFAVIVFVVVRVNTGSHLAFYFLTRQTKKESSNNKF